MKQGAPPEIIVCLDSAEASEDADRRSGHRRVRTIAVALVAAALMSGPGLALAQEEVPPDTVIQAALDAASAQLDVSADNLLVVMTAQRDWSDSSLGCPEPGRAYAQIITPGFIVTVDTDDLVTEVQVHTDRGTRAAIC